jgi:hypothetical protein
MVIRNQQGSISVIGIIFMIFMLIIISGLAFATTTNVKLMTKNKDALEAQYAAEAGAIRAKSGILNSSKEWSWLNTARAVAIDTNKTYNVVITPTIANGVTADSNTTYTIKSTGIVGNSTKVVYLTITPNKSDFPYALYNGGTSLKINSGFHIIYQNIQDTEGTLATKATSITNNAHFPVVTTTFTVPTITVSLNATTYQTGSTSLQSTLNQPLNATKGTYYAGNGMNMNSGSSISAAGGGDVIVFIKGGFNINGNLTTDSSTNLVIITDGSININSGTLNGNVKIYAQGNINVNSSGTTGSLPSDYVLIMTNGSITLNSSVTLNKAVIIAQKDLTFNPGDNLTGAILVGGNVTLNGGTIYYDPNVLSNWGKQN